MREKREEFKACFAALEVRRESRKEFKACFAAEEVRRESRQEFKACFAASEGVTQSRKERPKESRKAAKDHFWLSRFMWMPALSTQTSKVLACPAKSGNF